MNTPREGAGKGANHQPGRSIWRGLRWIVLVLLIALACAVLWILHSQSGAGFVLARVQAALDGKLQITRHEGTLSGPLQLEGLRFVDPAAGLDARINKLGIEPDLLALLGGRVEINSISVDGVQLDMTSVPVDPDEVSGEISLKAPIDIFIKQLALRTAAITLDGEPVLVVDSVGLVADWTASGIVVRQLDLHSPDGEVALTGSLATAPGYSGSGETNFRWKAGDMQLAGVLKSNSDGKRAHLQLDLTEPTPATLVMDVGQTRDAPWTMELDAPAFDLGKIVPDSTLGTLALDLQGSGNSKQGSLDGEISINEHQIQLDPLRFELVGDVLKIESLGLTSPESPGRFELSGDVGYAALPPSANFVATWQGVELPADLVGQVLASQGSLEVHGDLAGFDVRGDLTLGPPGQPANIGLDIHGNQQLITLNSVRLKQASGGLDASGTISLEPTIGWQVKAVADQFDPGAFAPDWPGALDFVIDSSGQLSDQGASGTLKIDSLTGRLRERPLSGSANLHMDPGYIFDGTLAIKSGDSQLSIEGKGGTSTDARIRFDIASLGDLLPDAGGKLDGNFHVTGKWPQIDINGEARAQDLSMADVQVSSAEVVASVKNLETPTGAFTLKASSVAYANLQFDTLNVEADGNKSSQKLKLDANGTPANIAFSMKGAGDRAAWKGQVDSLSLVPSRRNAPRLDLNHPATMNWDGKRFALDQACLVGSKQERRRKENKQEIAAGPVAGDQTEADEADAQELPARLCLDGNYSENGSLAGHYQIEHLPLRLLLRLAAPDSSVGLRGELAGEGEFNKAADGPLTGQARLQSSEGRLLFGDAGKQPAFGYKGFNVTANLSAASTVVQMSASLDNGRVDGHLTMRPVDGGSPALDGSLKIDLNNLAFLELLTSEVSNTQGSLHADYTIAGTLAAPRLNGALSLADFATEVPTVGLKLSQGSVRLRATDSEHFVVEGSVTSGSGTLTIAGDGELAARAPMTLSIKGEDFLAADIPAAKVLISPDLSIERSTEGVFVKGRITIPTADVDLSKLPGGGTIDASADVVVVDATEPEKAKPLPVTANVSIVLGDKVKLTGFGFDGKIIGELAVSDRPGRVTTANGALDVTGTYYAYGQNLKIDTGRVLFANTPIDNPALDIRATRAIEGENVTAGLNVRGTAQQPVLTVFSDPPRENADAVSYLMTGKPLAGGASFTFGKYLSPKLYLSYGVGIFEPGEVVTLRYLFNPSWNFEAVNTSEGNRAGINYRIEK